MFEPKDIPMCKGMLKLWNDATFPIKDREGESFVLVSRWVKELESKIVVSLKKPPKPQGIHK